MDTCRSVIILLPLKSGCILRVVVIARAIVIVRSIIVAISIIVAGSTIVAKAMQSLLREPAGFANEVEAVNQ
jgi:hypothetical protein